MFQELFVVFADMGHRRVQIAKTKTKYRKQNFSYGRTGSEMTSLRDDCRMNYTDCTGLEKNELD